MHMASPFGGVVQGIRGIVTVLEILTVAMHFVFMLFGRRRAGDPVHTPEVRSFAVWTQP